MENNRTTGSVLRTMLSFALPFLLSYFLQTLYGMADLFIIGQFNGVESTTAVSIGSQVMHMVTVMIVGLSMGSTVLIARAIGAQKQEEVSQTIGNTMTLFLGLSIVLTAVLLLLVRPIVRVMSTPTEAVEGTVSYLTICFLGIPCITAYNIVSAIFRGMGDSRHPMYFVAIACAANIGLDYLYIGNFGMGPAGAALGTTLSQGISVAVSIWFMVRRQPGLSGNRAYFMPRRHIMSPLLKIGLPVALQDGFIQVSFLLVTIIANQRGLNDAAAVGIVEKIIGFLFLVPSTMLSTVSALGAQNLGAGKPQRARQILGYGIVLCAAFGAASVLVMQLAAEPFIALFADDVSVIRMGGQYMRGYVWDCILAGIHFCFSGYFCACGRSELSFLHNILSTVFARVPLAYWASRTFADTLFPMGLATTIGSGVSVAICILAYLWMEHRTKERL